VKRGELEATHWVSPWRGDGMELPSRSLEPGYGPVAHCLRCDDVLEAGDATPRACECGDVSIDGTRVVAAEGRFDGLYAQGVRPLPGPVTRQVQELVDGGGLPAPVAQVVAQEIFQGQEPLADRHTDAAVLVLGSAEDLWETWRWFWDRRDELGLYPLAVGNERTEFGYEPEVPHREPDREPVAQLVAQAREGLFGDPLTDWGQDARLRWLPEVNDRDDPTPAFDPSDDAFWVRTDEPRLTSYHPHMSESFTLGLFPVARGYEALEALNWTDGNTHSTWFHAGVTRSWWERFGAEVISVEMCFMELLVPEPIRDRSAAFELALEQWSYADTVGDADSGIINEVASALTVSRVWSFWWD
jgi:hypothetical protein